MTTLKASHPGHCGDKPFVMPTSEEIAEADERADIERMNGWTRVLVLLTVAPLAVALGIHLYFR